jgi:hypothetical protein
MTAARLERGGNDQTGGWNGHVRNGLACTWRACVCYGAVDLPDFAGSRAGPPFLRVSDWAGWATSLSGVWLRELPVAVQLLSK